MSEVNRWNTFLDDVTGMMGIRGDTPNELEEVISAPYHDKLVAEKDAEIAALKQKVEQYKSAVVQINHREGYSHHKIVFQFNHPGADGTVIHVGEQIDHQTESKSCDK